MMLQKSEKVRIESKDGASSIITIYRNIENQASVIIIMPAMGVQASYYAPFAHSLVTQGLNVVTAELRGHGESSLRPSRNVDFGFREMVLYDWPCIMTKVETLYPHSPKIILGHSLGGQLSTLYLAENHATIDRLILVTAPSMYYKDYQFPISIGLLLATQLFNVIAKLLGFYPGHILGVGRIEAMQIVSDWARVARKGRFDINNSSFDYESHMQMLDIPVLAISFSDDVFAPKVAVDRLSNKMQSAQLTRWHIVPEDLDCKKLGHFLWINQKERLAERIAHWLKGDEGYG